MVKERNSNLSARLFSLWLTLARQSFETLDWELEGVLTLDLVVFKSFADIQVGCFPIQCRFSSICKGEYTLVWLSLRNWWRALSIRIKNVTTEIEE